MDVPWTYTLKPHQRSNPVVHYEFIDIPLSIKKPSESDMLKVWGLQKFGKGKYLKTWGRSKNADGSEILVDDPHFIAVRNGTPLHYDPKYPRYSYQLKLRVDGGTFVRGMDRKELELKRGIFYVLDSHSPHQVFLKYPNPSAWNISASIDSYDLINFRQTRERLLSFASTANILTGMIDEP